MAARKTGDRGARGVRLNPKHDERTRAKIQTSQIVNRLQSFVNGEVELSSTQVTAALGLLKKSLPDLQSVEYSGEVAVKDAAEYSTDELRARVSELSRRIDSEGGREGKPERVH